MMERRRAMRYFDLHCDTLVACLDQNKSLIDNDLHVSVKKGDRFAPYVQCAAVWLPDSVRGAAALQYFDRHAAYFRKMAIDGYIIKVDYTQQKKLAAAVSRAASNINQICRRINSKGNLYEDDVAELKERQKEIWQLLKSSQSEEL